MYHIEQYLLYTTSLACQGTVFRVTNIHYVNRRENKYTVQVLRYRRN